MRRLAFTMCAAGLLALALSACGNKDDFCSQAVRRVTFELIPKDGTGQPSEDERRTMEAVVEMGIAQCRKEGLSKEQADCIMDVHTVDQMLRLGDCPAIAAKRPSWLSLPPPELVPPATE
jgi:hypothetical protein